MTTESYDFIRSMWMKHYNNKTGMSQALNTENCTLETTTALQLLPSLGRFINRDPIEERGGWALFKGLNYGLRNPFYGNRSLNATNFLAEYGSRQDEGLKNTSLAHSTETIGTGQPKNSQAKWERDLNTKYYSANSSATGHVGQGGSSGIEWHTPDTSGGNPAANNRDLNLYGYAGNDPINGWDNLGMEADGDLWKKVAKLGNDTVQQTQGAQTNASTQAAANVPALPKGTPSAGQTTSPTAATGTPSEDPPPVRPQHVPPPAGYNPWGTPEHPENTNSQHPAGDVMDRIDRVTTTVMEGTVVGTVTGAAGGAAAAKMVPAGPGTPVAVGTLTVAGGVAGFVSGLLQSLYNGTKDWDKPLDPHVSPKPWRPKYIPHR